MAAAGVKWLWRVLACWVVALLPATGGDLELAHLLADFECEALPPPVVDQGRVIEEVTHARAWNALLHGGPLAAVDHDYLTMTEVLGIVEVLAPLIVCVAGVFEVPPALVAGLLATELDLDYNVIDSIVDRLIATGWGDGLTALDISAGYAGVHFRSLKPALRAMPPIDSPFFRIYRQIVLTRDDATLIRLASRYRMFDVANAAAMARHYAVLRLGERPLAQMTVIDMAFIWSAYRGGVCDTLVDPGGGYRWSLTHLHRAGNPHSFGDTILALPYFTHYRAIFGP